MKTFKKIGGSGTRDGFESITGTSEKCKYCQELTSTGDVITTVSGNPSAIGYASLAFVKDNVKAVSIDGVIPSENTVKDGSYKVQRPFITCHFVITTTIQSKAELIYFNALPRIKLLCSPKTVSNV